MYRLDKQTLEITEIPTESRRLREIIFHDYFNDPDEALRQAQHIPQQTPFAYYCEDKAELEKFTKQGKS